VLKSVLSKYFIEKEQLPKIKVQDPVCKEIGAVCRRCRENNKKKSDCRGADYYRLVIE
jgi:DNA-directed RNA polymerase subunit H